jgi:hypothetical protein
MKSTHSSGFPHAARRKGCWHDFRFIGGMIRATIPILLLVLILGIPAITTGLVYTGQVLFAMLVVLFLGTLADALTNRIQDDQ